ncbi:MAG: nuclear transport factor 2 family protein [Pseudomonadota bacterium]
MKDNIEIIRSFYAALAAEQAPRALALMADDIEWTTMWQYKAEGRGPQKVAEGVLMPMMKEWREVAFVPTEFIAQGAAVVSLGVFNGVHGATGKSAEARYAHVWTVVDGRIASFRQYIDTLAVAEACA